MRFEKVSKEVWDRDGQGNYEDIVIPSRGSKGSAGYDVSVVSEIVVPRHGKVVIGSGVKLYMEEGLFAGMFVRSSVGIKRGLRLCTGVSVIDSDYYGNENNEGHILIAIENTTDSDIVLNKSERIVQLVVQKYYVTDDEVENDVLDVRCGGIGSSGL